MSFLSEFHHAARALARAPGLVAVAVISLALGIGANATIFSFVNAVELRPLPFPESGRLVDVSQDNPKKLCEGCGVGSAWPTYRSWRASARSFSGLESYREEPFSLAGDPEAERIGGALVTAGLFSLLGIHPLMGRGFVVSDDEVGAAPVVLLSHGLWVRRFGGDSTVLGRAIRVNGVSRTVVGIMPPGFRFPEFAGLWLPMAPEVPAMSVNDRSLGVAGRLAPGVSLAVADAEMVELAGRMAADNPAEYAGWTARVHSLRADLTKDESGQGLLLALAASGFVLLIACANLANLFLARAASRARELAVRIALGATRRRVAGHLLAESLLIGMAGGFLGLVLSFWGIRLLTGLIGTEFPFWLILAPDWRLLLFTVLLSLLAGLAFGIVPALRASTADPHAVLKSGGPGGTGGRHDGRIRGALAVSQIALAIVLLAGAGLLVKSFLVARRTDNLGYNPRGVLSARFQMQEPRYTNPAAVRQMEGQLLERLAVQPMVEAAAVQHQEFLGTFIGTDSKVTLEGQAEPLSHETAPRFAFAVSPEFFRVRQLPILRGRGIGATDVAAAPAVAVVTGETGRQLWPGQDPLGKRLRIGDAATGRWLTVIGVTGDVVGSTLGRRQGKFLYTSAAQFATGPFELLVRFRGDVPTMATTLKAVARTIDADEPVEDVMTVEEGLAQSLAPIRFMVELLLGLGALALLLAASGIYGVMSYLVARRTRELGIRMALGAAAADVRKLVFRYGLRLALFGLLIGMPAAFGLATLLRRLLFSVSPSDPLVFASVGVLLAGIALLACWSPARRATGVDPLEALRSE